MLADDREPQIEFLSGDIKRGPEPDRAVAATDHYQPCIITLLLQQIPKLRFVKTERTKKSQSSGAINKIAELLLDFTEPGLEILTHKPGILDEILFLNNFQIAIESHHVHEIPTPRRVQTARLLKHIFLYFVHTSRSQKSADLRLLAERHHVGLDEILVRPHLSGEPHSGLHFIENKQGVVLVRKLSQPLEEVLIEVMIAAFALNRFDYDRGNIVLVLEKGLLDLSDRLLLLLSRPFQIGVAKGTWLSF